MLKKIIKTDDGFKNSIIIVKVYQRVRNNT